MTCSYCSTNSGSGSKKITQFCKVRQNETTYGTYDKNELAYDQSCFRYGNLACNYGEQPVPRDGKRNGDWRCHCPD